MREPKQEEIETEEECDEDKSSRGSEFPSSTREESSSKINNPEELNGPSTKED